MRPLLIVCLAWGAVLCSGQTTGPTPDSVVERYYQGRTGSALRVDAKLVASAHDRAVVLAATGELSHVDERGRGPAAQMLLEGGGPGTYGEILGAGAAFEQVWAAWLASPSHRAVLDEPGWQAWGWGRSPRGQTWVWVVRFWKP